MFAALDRVCPLSDHGRCGSAPSHLIRKTREKPNETRGGTKGAAFAPLCASPPPLHLGWISRLDLALELGVSVDTLRRWEARRTGPPCVRAGRKVYYRRDAVQDWLEDQEQTAPRRRRAGGRR